VAPEKIVASKREKDDKPASKVVRTRPLCAYPQDGTLHEWSTGNRREHDWSSRAGRGSTNTSTPSSMMPLSSLADFRRCTSMS